MTRELEKSLAKKISIYQSRLKMQNNGMMPKSKSELVLDFYRYSLNHIIEGIEDIPKKYKEIFED